LFYETVNVFVDRLTEDENFETRRRQHSCSGRTTSERTIMKVSVEEVSPVKRVLEIEIPHEIIAKELDKAYKKLKKQAKIKGFRPGKAPRSVLERLYKKDVNADVSSRLLQETFVE